MLNKRKEILDFLVKEYGVTLSMTEVSKVIALHKNHVPKCLHDNGITVRKIGREKRVLAGDIAEFLVTDHISPIENSL